MAASDFDQEKLLSFDLKRFAIYCAISWLALLALSFVLIAIFNYNADFRFMTLIIPMIAGTDAGNRFADSFDEIPSKSLAWRAALRLNWINLAVQVLFAFVVILLAGADMFSAVISGLGIATLMIIVFIVLALVFLLSWVFIRFGLYVGAKNALKIKSRKSQ